MLNIMTREDFCSDIENYKKDNNFETYIETISEYVENKTEEMSYEQVKKLLNQKILDHIKLEAIRGNMLKVKHVILEL